MIESFDATYSSIINSIFSLESTESRYSNSDRVNIIIDALYSSLTHPIGVGIDCYREIYSNKRNVYRISNSAENAYLTLLVESGWLSLGFFGLFFITVIRKAYESNSINLNKILLVFLGVYYFLNYELNNVFANFCWYIVMLSYLYTSVKFKNEFKVS